MPVHEEKKTRYADLARRLAASKARAAARHRGEKVEGAPEEGKGNGAPAPAGPAKRKAAAKPKQVGPKKLTKEQKRPKLTEEPKSTVDPGLRDMLGDNEADPNTGLSMFQIALVEKIKEHGELGVLDLCYMIWEKAEILQARVSPISGKPVDLTRVVRNAIRSPKAAGIIAHASTRGKYVFVEWKKAGRRKGK